MKKQWCDFPEQWDGVIGYIEKAINHSWGIMDQPRPKNRYIRCPECNKRLLIQWYDCGDGNCWHPRIGKHKVK